MYTPFIGCLHLNKFKYHKLRVFESLKNFSQFFFSIIEFIIKIQKINCVILKVYKTKKSNSLHPYVIMQIKKKNCLE